MSGSLLDTSVLIASDEAGALDLPPTAAISVVSVGELRAGALLSKSREVTAVRSQRLEAVRAAFLALAVDDAVADGYGTVLAAACAARRTVKATDLLIVATALVHGRTLVTLDGAQAEVAELVGVPVHRP